MLVHKVPSPITLEISHRVPLPQDCSAYGYIRWPVVLYAFFWVIPRRLNFICQRLGTICLFRLHRRMWRWNRQIVPKRWHIKFRRRGITQKKAYNTAKVWNQEWPVVFHELRYSIHVAHVAENVGLLCWRRNVTAHCKKTEMENLTLYDW